MVALKKVAQKFEAVETTTPFAADVLKGLKTTPKRISPKYFYDATGSALFEQITDLPEYYLTRTELRILEDNAAAIAAYIPPGAALVEFGSGSSKKTRILLAVAPQLAAYVPVDISGEMLQEEADELRKEFPKLDVHPVIADFTQPFELPDSVPPLRTGFFPGSTIGNFEPHEAATFLRQVATILGPGAHLIVGTDLQKESRILNAAYNDAAGVTRAFNLNILERINRELGGNFNLDSFEHHAFYNRERHRIEMHLASNKRQKVRVAGETIDFRAGETIHTENSYKYSAASFNALARGTGWTPAAAWSDPNRYFCVHALTLRKQPGIARNKT